MGISQSFLNRAGFDIFTSGAHRVGEGAGHYENVQIIGPLPPALEVGKLARGQKGYFHAEE